MDSSHPRPVTLRGFALSLVAVFSVVVLASMPTAEAQYGGVSGLFVTTSPTNPGFADFTGLGCAGGEEVVLYMPGIVPTSADPAATQSVPGRILAVTTSTASANALEDGTFAFPNIELPTDLDPGTYRVHSRCGDLDLEVFIQIASDGAITLEPDLDAPIQNEIPEALPFTGRNASRLMSFAAGLLALGVSLAAYSRRSALGARR